MSVLYGEGTYGETAAKATRRIARERGVCIPTFELVTEEGANEVARKMELTWKARVVITFLSDGPRFALYDSLQSLGLSRYFQWIAADILVGSNDGPRADGTIVLHQVVERDDAFEAYFHSLTPASNPQNPWLPLVWEYYFNCKWDSVTPNDTCEPFRNSTITDMYTPPVASLYMDAVLVYAHAIHDLIASECPEAFAEKSLVKPCVKGYLLLQYLRNVSFIGYNGGIEFDQNGDRLGKFSFKQYVHSNKHLYTDVGFWDKGDDMFVVYDEKISWFSRNTLVNQTPVSICSQPCKRQQYILRLELPCCWQCRSCPVNAILNENKTGCDLCPSMTWPDEATNTHCEPILPDYLHWNDPTVVVLVSIGALGVLSTTTTMVWYFTSRQKKLIKASSLQLSYVLLVGIKMAYLSVFPHAATPSKLTCLMGQISFNLAVTFIYAPLLVKTVRVYRIFKSGERGVRHPKLTNNRAQMVFTGLCISVQVGGFLSMTYTKCY